ncbi:hypothetical protein KVR01_008964 [Diaporthe batatas]|uniref:uncharacterized protein n=1 Tax=Diaporthe batatas TaxID=748121 RepID=UPI001D050846|nr:uncharacterized protein KVR01_008964 [Diaporthe batatas]KAG8160700.1 hypothetical protein KVR01_008964 [Diaporthe batatas]
MDKYSHKSILSLPDELLVEIFSAVKTHNPNNKAQHASFASSSADIANVRLVCRRFEACSSHLLVHYIKVDGINSESLDKLEAISMHPVIRNGVHIVRLVTQFYSSVYANDIRRFACHAVSRVFGQALRFKQDLEAAEDEEADAEGAMERREEAAVALAKVKAILKTWGRVSLEGIEHATGPWSIDPEKSSQDCMALCRRNSGEDENDEAARHLQLLHVAHQLYRLRYQDQERLRQGDTFTRRFSAAMARMPKAKGIEFHDFGVQQSRTSFQEEPEDNQSRVRFAGTDEYAGLMDIDSLVLPVSWGEALDRSLGDPPVEVLFGIPTAIDKAGARLDRISVQTSTNAEQYYPLFNKVEMSKFVELRTAINRMSLRSFIFLHQDEMKPRARQSASSEETGAFYSFISAVTNSNGLERFWLRLDGGWSDGGLDADRPSGIGPLLLRGAESPERWGQAGWGNLRDMHLSNVALHLSDLSRLGAQLKESGARLEFLTVQRARLLSGTWSLALEVLRGVEVEYEKQLVEPSGAECEDLARASGGRYDTVFGSDKTRSMADDFINGKTENNPLHESDAVEDLSSVDGEDVVVEVTVGGEGEDFPYAGGIENEAASHITWQMAV